MDDYFFNEIKSHPSFCRRSSYVGFAHSDHGCLFLWFYTRSGFIRGLHFGTSPFFHACAHGRGTRTRTGRRVAGRGREPRGHFHVRVHGRADARFHLGAFRSEIPPIPTPTSGPSCVKTYVGAWSDTPRRGRPALYRGKRGRAISLRNAPRRSPAHPQTHGGNTVGSRSAQGDGPSVGPLIGPSVGAMIGPLVGAVIGPSVGIYGRGRRPRRPAPGAERPTAGPGAWGRTGARDARPYQRRSPRASRPTWGAWEVARADTPYRGRPAPRAALVQRAPGRGGEGVGPCRIRTRPARPSRVRAISLRNAPRRQRASPRGRGGSMVDIAR